MKTRALLVLWMSLPGIFHAPAQSTAFTYQGRLNWQGQPANGWYDFSFGIMDAEFGGAIINGSVVLNAVGVTNGLFTVMLNPGTGVFNGSPRWLSILVRTNGATSFTQLAPRQPITSAPYAIRAGEAAKSLEVNGSVKANTFQLGTTAPLGAVLTANATGVGTWQTPQFLARSGDTINGSLTIVSPYNLSFGASTRQMVNLYNAGYGIGVQANTLYQRSDGGFAWFQRGVHHDSGNNAGAGGTNLMWLSSTGDLFANASVTADAAGANAGTIYPGLVFGLGSGEGISSARAAGSANRYGIDFYTGFQKRLSISGSGSVGIGTVTPEDALLDVEGAVRLNDQNIYLRAGSDRNHGIAHRSAVSGRPIDGPFVYGYNGGALGTSSPDSPVLTWDYRGNIWVSNDLSLATLTVRGGADLAEPFPMPADVPKGAAVIIDDENPGALKLSTTAYDKRVAGIVSGANGINPGITLHQEGVLDGGRHVALSGRLYALADTSSGPIQAGDLLTTSDIPGHVMRVADHARAQGAIVGKAMSSLKERQGLVLVLVSLQ